jgi:hypothetical protein
MTTAHHIVPAAVRAARVAAVAAKAGMADVVAGLGPSCPPQDVARDVVAAAAAAPGGLVRFAAACQQLVAGG